MERSSIFLSLMSRPPQVVKGRLQHLIPSGKHARRRAPRENVPLHADADELPPVRGTITNGAGAGRATAWQHEVEGLPAATRRRLADDLAALHVVERHDEVLG